MDKFDLKRVTKLEWTAVGAGILAFIVSFLPWFSFDAGIISSSVTAWGVGIGGWGPVLLLIACAALVLAPHFDKQVPNAPLIWLVASGAALLIILLRWITLPSSGVSVGLGTGLDAGAGFGLFLGLVAAAVSVAGAVVNFLAARKTV